MTVNGILMALLCFVLAFTTDWCWTKYIKRASDGNAPWAAFWSVFIYGLGSAGTYIFIHNPWQIIPMMAGYYFGTFYAVQHSKEKQT